MRAMLCLMLVIAGCGGGTTCDENTKGYVACEIGGGQCQPGQYCGRNEVDAPVCLNGCLSDTNCGCNQVCTKTAGQNEGICNLHAAMSVCGDGLCDGVETSQSCAKDCVAVTSPHCGDNVCNGAETKQSCPADCHTTTSCGDGACNGSETSQTCPGDCPPAATCGDGICAASETGLTCPKDCPNVTGCRQECESYDFFSCFGAGELQTCYDRCAIASAAQITQFDNCAGTATTSCDTSCLSKLPN